MRAVVQRVNSASVTVNGERISSIGKGLVVFVGIKSGDKDSDAVYIADKVANLRIFEDENGKMNLSPIDIKGDVLAVSQFTLYGDVRAGRRPDFTQAAKPDEAKILYETFITKLKGFGLKVGTGKFKEMMKIDLENDGPVTIMLDSEKAF